MRDASAFDDTPFLGLARPSKRDPYRMALFARHLDPAERPLAFLGIQGGTLVVTDRRILEFRPHLEVHGAWNVKEFQGYEVRRQLPRSSVRGLAHRVDAPEGGAGPVLDRLLVDTADGSQEFLVSRGPEGTLTDADFLLLRDAVLGSQPK